MAVNAANTQQIPQAHLPAIGALGAESRRPDADLLFTGEQVSQICQTCKQRSQPNVDRAEIRPGTLPRKNPARTNRLISHAPREIKTGQKFNPEEAAQATIRTRSPLQLCSSTKLGTLGALFQLTRTCNPKLANLIRHAAATEKAKIQEQKLEVVA